MSRKKGGQPHRATVIQELVLALAESERKREALSELVKELAADDTPRNARDLYREDWSNRRIAEKLGIPLAEARKLTARG